MGVKRNLTLHDQAQVVANYRAALSLGEKGSFLELCTTTGARFAFDTETLREAVGRLREGLMR